MYKQRIYHIIEWVVALAACGFLGWKMITFEDYPALWATVCGMGVPQYAALVLCVLLMPVNMSLEAWRWRTLLPMSRREAHRQVYYSKLAGLITPWRLGEYPARGVLMNEGVKELKSEGVKELKSEGVKELKSEGVKELKSEGVKELKSEGIWSRVLSMGAVGSATMTMAIIAAGLTAMILEIGGIVGLGVIGIPGDIGNLGGNGEWWITVAAAMILLTAGLLLAPRMLRRYAEVSHRLVAISVGQSLVRLGCWCVQLALVLFALGAYQSPITNYQLPIYYLLVTITPNMPIAEVGVRGAWAIAVFGSMNAAFAGVLLWIINTLLPCLIWPFIRKKT